MVGYEGYYEVSNLGNVRAVTRMLKKGQHLICRKGRPVKLDERKGYLRAPLCKDSILRFYSVHRLVAEAFIPNPNNYPCVNHKDENRKNNNASNLEWCTYEHNNKWNNRHLKIATKLSKQVAQYSDKMELIAIYPSESEAARQVGTGGDHIGQCCKGLRQMAGGYKWRYV